MNIEELARLIQNLIRLGTVTEVQYQIPPRVRVKTGELETNWLVWGERRAGTTRTWDPPTIGEQVILLSPGGDLTGSVVWPAVNSDAHPVPTTDKNVHMVEYPDGATCAYNHQDGKMRVAGIKNLVIEAAEQVTINCNAAVINANESVDINCPKNTVNGELTVTGLLTYQSGMVGSGGAGGSTAITGNITHNSGNYTHTGGKLSSNGVVLDTHKHDGVLAGGDQTGEPV